jgi:hypothetical protein
MITNLINRPTGDIAAQRSFRQDGTDAVIIIFIHTGHMPSTTQVAVSRR